MLQINITAISFEGHNGVFEGNISLGVKDTKQVDDIIHKLNDIDGVVNVLRYDY
jgi:GTP pyrophosphokinase